MGMIKRMRKRLLNKKWVARKYKELVYETGRWNTFEKFECSSFFRGYRLAEYNREIYKKGIRKTYRQLRFLEQIINKFKS